MNIFTCDNDIVLSLLRLICYSIKLQSIDKELQITQYQNNDDVLITKELFTLLNHLKDNYFMLSSP